MGRGEVARTGDHRRKDAGRHGRSPRPRECAAPLNDDGTVDEEAKGVTHIDEVEDVAACSAASLDVSLKAGSYVIICNLPGHYASGMHTAFTVT